MQDPDVCISLFQEPVHDVREQILRRKVPGRNALQESRESFFQNAHEGRLKSPHIHGDKRIRVDDLKAVVRHFRRTHSGIGLDDVLRFLDSDQTPLAILHADAPGHAAVIAQRIFQYEACHADIARFVLAFSGNETVMDFLKTFFPVVIVCIDDDERLLHEILCRKKGLSGSPGFHSSCRNAEAFRQIVQFLIGILHLHRLLDAAADDAAEIRVQIPADNKDDFIEARFQRVVNRIVHNDLTVRSDLFQLFDSAAVPASDSCCQNN